jgi:hypothetical protein
MWSYIHYIYIINIWLAKKDKLKDGIQYYV